MLVNLFLCQPQHAEEIAISSICKTLLLEYTAQEILAIILSYFCSLLHIAVVCIIFS